jgi:hypothetical protein
MRKRNTVTALLVLAFVSLFAARTQAADYAINPTGTSFQLNSLVWGTSGSNGFNNNYYFSPLYGNGSVCVSVENNNPTNGHTFTVSIVITSDATENSPSDGTWQIVAQSQGLNAPISPGILAGLGANISGAIQVSINFSASSTLAGSPDTADIHIIQTQGNCTSGNNFIGNAAQSIAAMQPVLAISDGLSQAFEATSRTSNPVSTTNLLHVNVNNGAHTLYFTRVIITSTSASAVILTIQGTSTLGTTCTGSTIGNQRISSPTTSTATANFVCTTIPLALSFSTIDIAVPPNGTATVDLTGFIATAATLNGLEVSNSTGAGLTGNFSCHMFWYEK